MTPRTLKLDWRGGNYDLSGMHDFYSVFSTHTKRPVTGNPNGRVLAAFSSGVLFKDEFPAMRPFNQAVYYAAKHRGAMTDRVIWTGMGGWHTRLVDLTKRGMVGDLIMVVGAHLGWADGYHIDFFSAWSWLFPDLAPTDDAWDRALAGLANMLRSTGKLVLAQQWHLTPPVMATSGAFLEVTPTSFGQTLESHEVDVRAFRDLTGRVDKREVLFVSELREPGKYPQWYRDQMRAWAIENDIVVSCGRDAAAGQAL